MDQTVFDRISAQVDSHHPQAIALLRELVMVPTDTPPGNNAPHAERAAELLEAMGFEVERLAVPEALVREHGLQTVTNLVVRQRFGSGPTIALNAHGDVVPPGEGWTRPPYKGVIENGRMYGRGVAVSKSDFATYAYALHALRKLHEQGLVLNGTVELHFTYDEEMGGAIGPGWLLAHKRTRPDFAICAGFSYAIVTAHNGCLHLEITVHGTAAHAAQPETGIDALQASTGILNALYASKSEFSNIRSGVSGIECPTLNVGLIEGGTNTNVVPGKVVFKLDRRMIPEENAAEVEANLRQLIEDTARKFPGVRVKIKRLLLANAMQPLPGQEKLVAALKKNGERVFGEPIPATGTPLYTDARLYVEAGVPTVLYGAGPRTILESGAKRADEHLVLEDLRKATQVIANSVADFLA
jgi:acetylornithine deacetylase/succinyl-diaminopimelate desuccinylase family protein